MTLLAPGQAASADARERDAPRPHSPAPGVWERLVAPAVEALSDRAPRALVVGNAGSGKSATLRHLHALLTEQSRDAVHAHAVGTDIDRVPDAQVLIVDDLHRADPARIAQVRDRAANPDAGLIVALRPTAWDERLVEIMQHLERHGPSVLLGHVSRADAVSYLDRLGLTLPEGCLHHILEATAGVAWLVSDALRMHDVHECRGDAGHRELRAALEEHVAHRVSMLAPPLRDEVERICIAPPGVLTTTPDAADILQLAYAEGLLLRNGQPVPLVRSAVQATMPAARFIALSASDAGLADALARHADQLLPTHPERAAELYEAAVQTGMPAASLTGRRAAAAWSVGDLDAASALVDASGSPDGAEWAPAGDAGDRDRLTDTAAAIWSARGMMQQACAVYRASPPANPLSAVRARVAELAVGAVDRGATGQSITPSTLGVAMSLLRRGLDESVAPAQAEAALTDLVRSSEMYTAARSSAGVPELPAVIAAIVALNLGGLSTARSVIDDAIAGEQGGQWARSRLLLWRAWIAVQLARPGEARDALADAAPARSARDVLLSHAVQVAIARRYEDAAGLEAAWRQARASLLRVDIDLFLLHPLAELISSASRVGDADRIRPQFRRALEIVGRLDDPALWAAHLHWAGIQNGILLNSPDSLRPHAKALVAASADSRIAATMARAGRVWTAVLGGTVDAEAVEKAAHGLAAAGLIWDAARLAGHGAARAQDRKVSSRLLACARELHPIDGSRRAMAASGTDAAAPASTPPQEVLSERELEVARLVLEGKTYAEIGETIFISPRTAEHHIAHIRRRLGANSRSEVIAKLRQLIGSDTAAPPGTSRVYRGGPGAPP